MNIKILRHFVIIIFVVLLIFFKYYFKYYIILMFQFHKLYHRMITNLSGVSFFSFHLKSLTLNRMKSNHFSSKSYIL